MEFGNCVNYAADEQADQSMSQFVGAYQLFSGGDDILAMVFWRFQPNSPG
ncbi:MAG: hypothetical protein ACI8Z1_002284 [Candidatus Azotimanducaceae bacterium]|jgi:hypothetical protein